MEPGRKIGIFRPLMKPALAALGLTLIAATLAPAGFAQAIPMTRAWSVYLDLQTAIQVPGAHDITWGSLARFDNLLDRQPGLATELYAHPQAIDEPDFLSHHAALREHLATNPEIREELIRSPSCLTQRESRFDQVRRAGGGVTRVNLDSLDGYLDGDPAAAARLEADPSLATDADFLGRHPELALFFRNYPGMVSELHTHPGWLKWRKGPCARQQK